MSAAEIKSDTYKLFERIGEDDLTFWSMVRAMAEQYLATQKYADNNKEQLVRKIVYYSFIEEKDRLLELNEKLENEVITEEENEELAKLIKKVEEYAFHRLNNIIKLATLRGVTTEEVLKEFAHLTYQHALYPNT